MHLYNTRSRQIEELHLEQLVKIYTCGITPYDSAHIGHAAMVITYDILQRRLRDAGHRTELVRNITDVDDSILGRARETGEDWKELGNRQTAYFDKNMKALNVLPLFAEPRASEAMPDILGFIGILVDRGHAYETDGAVYFDISTWPQLGEISRLSRPEMLEIAAERGGNPDDQNKRDPLDFVLWQPSLEDEPAWDSIWGPGRPGWHIECSAMAMRELGTTIDIHGGGTDLIFPHHECENAQSEAATGESFVQHWMHVAMVYLNGQKMSKSLGNLVFVGDLLEAEEPAAVRLACAANHYRKEWEWSNESMDHARQRLADWRRAGRGDGALQEVREALDDDLRTDVAVSAIDRAAKTGAGVSSAASLLGIEL